MSLTTVNEDWQWSGQFVACPDKYGCHWMKSKLKNSPRLAAKQRLRVADAVHAAVAQRYGATLVTRDQQQLERLHPISPVLTPTAALAHLVNLTHKNKEAE